MPPRDFEPEDLSPRTSVIPTTSLAATGIASIPGASAAVAVGLHETPEGRITIPLRQMVEYAIDGYLLCDLESMVTEITLKEVGACGYPIVMAVLSGSELLGALTSRAVKTNRIETYWRTYMARVDSRYTYLGKIASQLARNGIAHSYLSHLGVHVTRGDPEHHLGMTASAEVIFDCLALYDDFRTSYEAHARSYILENSATAQSRLDELVRDDLRKAHRLIKELPADRFQVPNPTGDRAESVDAVASRAD
jgi:hypothetical protein